jgi:hypothetical protein
VLLRMAADQERADRIRALKLSRPDLTWRRIADHVGVTERSATDWQKLGGIDYENAKKLAEIFEVEHEYIWRGPTEEERAPSPFAGQDALADRFDALEQHMTDQLGAVLQDIKDQLVEQNKVLADIKAEQATLRGLIDGTAELRRLAQEMVTGRQAAEPGPEPVLPPPAAAKKSRAKAQRTR